MFARASACLVLIWCILLAATPYCMAAGVDWHDYVENISVDVDTLNVTLRFPLDRGMVQLRSNGANISTAYDTASITWNGSSSTTYEVLYYLFNRASDMLDASYIPAGAEFGVTYSIDISRGHTTPVGFLSVQKYNSRGEFLSGLSDKSSTGQNVVQETYTRNVTITKTPETALLRPVVDISGIKPVSNGSIRFWVDELYVTMTIPQLVEQQYQSQKTNKILEAVQYKLAENGQKLDEVLSGSSLNDHDWENIDEDIHQKGDDILDDIEAGNIDKPDPSDIPDPYDALDERATTSLAALVAPLWQNPILMGLLMMALALMGIRFFLYGKE